MGEAQGVSSRLDGFRGQPLELKGTPPELPSTSPKIEPTDTDKGSSPDHPGNRGESSEREGRVAFSADQRKRVPTENEGRISSTLETKPAPETSTMPYRPYRRCTATAVRTGERCRALPLPLESVCVRHLEPSDPRRIAFMADCARRTRIYWDRWRIAMALASSAEAA